MKGQQAADARYSYDGPGGRLSSISGDGHDLVVGWSGDKVTALRVAPFTRPYRLRYASPAPGETEVLAPGATTPTVYRHDTERRLTRVSAGKLVTVERSFDSSGRLASQRDGQGTIRFAWSGPRLGSSDRLVAGRWIRTTYRWDNLGRLTEVRRNGGHPRRLQYNGQSWQPVASIDETDRKTTFTYQDGLLRSTTDADGVVTRVSVKGRNVRGSTDGSVADAGVSPAAQAQPFDPSKQSGRSDDAGRPTSIPQPGGAASLGYDSLGRVDDVRSPGGDSHLTFNRQDRVATSRIPHTGHRRSYAWDDAGRLREARTDCPSAESGSCSTSFIYDDVGRLLHQRGPSGSVDRSYDDAGRVDSITRDATRWAITKRTRAGRPSELRGPEDHIVSVTYDKGGRVASVRTRDGVATRYRYEKGLLVELERGTIAAHLSHDRAGRISAVQTALGRYGYSYDKAGRLAAVAGPGRAARYRYDRAGRLASQSRGSTRTEYSYDRDGRMVGTTSKTESKKEVARTFRYRAGRLVGLEGDGASASVEYGPDGRPALVRDGKTEEHWSWRTDGRLDRVVRGDHRFDLHYKDGHLVRITDNGDPLAQLTWNRHELSVRSEDRSALASWDGLGNPIEVRPSGEEKAVRYSYTTDGAVAEVREGDDVAAAVKWHDGVPTALTTPSGSLRFACSTVACSVQSTRGDDRLKLEYRDGALASAVRKEYAIRFVTDESGRVTRAERTHGSSRKSGEFKDGEWTGQLGNTLKHLLTDDRKLPGLSTTPLLPASPGVDAVPAELRPEGLTVDLPDDVVSAGLVARTPSLPSPMMSDAGGDDWLTGLLGQLAPTRSPALQVGPFASFERPGVAAGDEAKDDWWHGADPLDEHGWGSAHKAMAGALTAAPSFFQQALSFVHPFVAFFPDIVLLAGAFLPWVRLFTSAALTGMALRACVFHTGSCASALVAAVGSVLVGPVGRVAGRLAQVAFDVGVDLAADLLRGRSLPQALIGAGIGLAGGVILGSLVGGAVLAVCRTSRVLCYPRAIFPETAASYTTAGARRGRLLQIDRAGATARRAEALAGVEPRAGFDRDEFPPAFSRQGGAGALVTYVSPAENRAAGAFFGHSVRDLRDGQRFLFLVTDLPSQGAGLAHATGATVALVVTGQARGTG